MANEFADNQDFPLAGESARGSRWRRLRRSELLPGLLFISPWIIGFAWFQLYPIVASIRYSFTNYNMMQPPLWIGLDNYTRLFTEDELFRKALSNTAIYALFSVPLRSDRRLCLRAVAQLEDPGADRLSQRSSTSRRSSRPWQRPSSGRCC